MGTRRSSCRRARRARCRRRTGWCSELPPTQTFLSFQGRDGGGAPAAAGTKCDNDASSGVSGGKLSFKWEADSCSSASSVVYLPLSFASAPAGAADAFSAERELQPLQWVRVLAIVGEPEDLVCVEGVPDAAVVHHRLKLRVPIYLGCSIC